MKSQNDYTNRSSIALKRASIAALLMIGTLLLTTRASAFLNGTAYVVPPDSTTQIDGRTYPQWAGQSWKWFMELPLHTRDGVSHPGLECANFDVTEGQTGDVWFLAAPFGDCTRAATIPSGKSLFIALLDSEWSSLETAGTPVCTNVQDASCQLANATYFADHIVDLFFEIDGSRLARPSSFRFVNPQINFFAPCPDWIFKSVPNARPSQPPAQACGPATSTGDGYFVFVNPLSAGQHKIHYGGAFKFTQKNDGFDAYFPIDITYSLTVQ